jgi:hypothetical protein
MKKEVIITGFSNASKDGVVLHTNIPAKLKTGNVKGNTSWVSWDKIGAALFNDYTERNEVAELDELRNK